ncbi:polysaccharide pyruvyl transferase family protein [Gryllotalpicola ginsengisoli]|uniref:polysaccharide pyruvyl transferase family protein n=1 Tax=Gryllotalpicola ginsengisoli TaxID=444608 RepID=UPI0003B5B3EB|nr:polysaccharide pyruvyl transferase family protein [Gryllotalpicola ginsengisoli]
MAEAAGRALLVGEFGCGNYGNDGTLEVVHAGLRTRLPGWEFRVLARDPRVVESQFGIGGWPIYRRTLGGPAGKLLGRGADALRYLRAVLWADSVTVVGTGLLEGDLNVGALGMPYLVMVLSVLCFVLGKPFLLLSVGVSRQPNRWAQRFLTWGGRLASYRSFRDPGSTAEAIRVGAATATDPTTVDAFFAAGPTAVAAKTSGVGVGVMNYFGANQYAGAEERQAARQRYIRAMADLVQGLRDRGRPLRFYTGDAGDHAVVEELRRELTARGVRTDDIPTDAARTVVQVSESMARCDAIIAARYHNLIAAALARRPLIGLAYAQKIVALAERVGLPGHTYHLATFDPAAVLHSFDELIADREATARLAERVTGLVGVADAELDRVHLLLKRGVRGRQWSRASAQTAPAG